MIAKWAQRSATAMKASPAAYLLVVAGVAVSVVSPSGVFLLGYGVFRSAVEFVRVPDVQLGYLALGWLTMGQILSIPLIVAGLVLLWLAYRNGRIAPAHGSAPSVPTPKRAR